MANHRYHLTRLSNNAKTGPIPVSTTSADSCPQRCSLKGQGCYAEAGPLGMHWKAVPDKGVDLDTFCEAIRALPKFTLWRHNQAGDLPGNGRLINAKEFRALIHANRGRLGFTYSHYSPYFKTNAALIQEANTHGFTVNLSANSLREVDKYLDLGIAPVVTVLPVDTPHTLKTPAGHTVTVCPAVTTEGVTCASCGVCQRADRKTVIGFPAHGSSKRRAERVFWMEEQRETEPA